MTTPQPPGGFPGQSQQQPQQPPPGNQGSPQAGGAYGAPPQAGGSYGAPPQHNPGMPPGQWPTPNQSPPRTPAQRAAATVWVLGLVSVAAVIIGLSVKEDGTNAWSAVNAWGALAIIGSLLTLAPAVGGGLGLGPRRAWQVAACGAGALVLFWVLFTLPEVGSNTSLATTIGVAAGVVSVWVSASSGAADSGRPGGPSAPPHTW